VRTGTAEAFCNGKSAPILCKLEAPQVEQYIMFTHSWAKTTPNNYADENTVFTQLSVNRAIAGS